MPTVSVYADPTGAAGLSPDQIETAVQAAVHAWDQVPGIQVSLEYDGFADATHQVAPDDDVIWFNDQWDHSSDLLAVTSNSSEGDGSMDGFDMEINVADHSWTTNGDPEADDLQNTLTHELGHVLGLAHNKQDATVTMWATTDLGETSKRDLANDDMRGALHLYGDSAARTMTGMGCSTVPGSALPLMGLLAAFGAALSRRSA